MTKDEMKDRISLALKDPILQQGFEIICKENAELKAQIDEMKCCGNCEHFDFNAPNYCYKGMYREHLNLCAGWDLRLWR